MPRKQSEQHKKGEMEIENDWKDALAFVIAAFQTVAVPLALLALALFLFSVLFTVLVPR
jgi:hypothetical protein